MKTLKDHIVNKFIVKSAANKTETLVPDSFIELLRIVTARINTEGPECDLNDIDVSKIRNLSYLFANTAFDGDISDWDVSNCKSFNAMFYRSAFSGKNSDLSRWDIHNADDFAHMFDGSKFDGRQIYGWDIPENADMQNMFDLRYENSWPKWYIKRKH